MTTAVTTRDQEIEELQAENERLKTWKRRMSDPVTVVLHLLRMLLVLHPSGDVDAELAELEHTARHG